MAKRMLNINLNHMRDKAKDGMAIFSPPQVNLLLDHIKALEEDEKIYRLQSQRMQEQIDRLIENVSQLSREKCELEEKLEAADELVSFNSYEEKKVALPSEVAEAIEWFRLQCMTNEEIYDLSTEPQDGKYASILNVWSDTGPGDGNLLMEALVNGYTVEEPPTAEERMRAKIEHQLFVCNVTSPVPPAELARQLTLAVREALAEDRQEETTN